MSWVQAYWISSRSHVSVSVRRLKIQSDSGSSSSSRRRCEVSQSSSAFSFASRLGCQDSPPYLLGNPLTSGESPSIWCRRIPPPSTTSSSSCFNTDSSGLGPGIGYISRIRGNKRSSAPHGGPHAAGCQSGPPGMGSPSVVQPDPLPAPRLCSSRSVGIRVSRVLMLFFPPSTGGAEGALFLITNGVFHFSTGSTTTTGRGSLHEHHNRHACPCYGEAGRRGRGLKGNGKRISTGC